MSITLAQASTVVDAILKKARELRQMPQTVVVLDAGGHVVCAKREDGSGIIRFEVAEQAQFLKGVSRQVLGLVDDNNRETIASVLVEQKLLQRAGHFRGRRIRGHANVKLPADREQEFPGADTRVVDHGELGRALQTRQHQAADQGLSRAGKASQEHQSTSSGRVCCLGDCRDSIDRGLSGCPSPVDARKLRLGEQQPSRLHEGR